MAKRPVFIPFDTGSQLVKEIEVTFDWNPGMAPSQKKKNVSAIHEAAANIGITPLLEISTKSEERLGQRLSAFNLEIESDVGRISIESAFQGSKIFDHGGPFTDLYLADSRAAKKDPRLRDSGTLQSFRFFEDSWPLVPKTAFYDWLYLNALKPHSDYLTRLFSYQGFTDIEFNPKKSINCQARTCALFVALLKRGKLDKALYSQQDFIAIVESDSLEKDHSADLRQGSLL